MAQAAAQRAAATKPAVAAQRAARAPVRSKDRRAAGAAQPAPAAGSAAGLPRYLRDGAAGQPLPAGVQREMEGRFGAPLADVRVHTGAGAAASAAAAGARAYTAGSDIVFGDGPGGSRYAPGTAEGRGLLAHELTHVVQQRRAGTATPQHSAADGGGRRGADEHEAEANARQAAGSAPLLARQLPAAAVQHADDDDPWYARAAGAVGDAVGDAVDTVEDVASAGAELVGDVADYAADLAERAALAVVRRVAPKLLPLIDPGPMALLRGMVGAALGGFADTLNALNPSRHLTALFSVFTGLATRAAGIANALLSGDCRPLLDAVGALRTFVTEVAGAAWSRLTSFLAPVGNFFSDLWTGYLQPGVDWLQGFAGDVWAGITQFGRDIWAWIEPVRDALGSAWDWVKDKIFGAGGAGSGDSSGGILDWITAKAGEAWKWVKEQTAPVWRPIANVMERVRDMLPPEFLEGFGTGMQQLSTQLDTGATAMAGGDGVAEQRETLATVLPSVGRLIATARGAVVSAGTWVGSHVAAVGGAVSGMLGTLRNSMFSALAGALGWLESAALRLTAWAEAGVARLFGWLLAAFDALSPFIEHLAGVVRRLVGVVGDLMRLPLLVGSTVWNLIPCCIREPIKNFLLNQILGRIPVFGQFFTDPTLWPRVQSTALHILRQVFVNGDLAGAAWTFFQAVLRVLGLPPELVVQILAKAARAIGDILLHPVSFLVNLLGAVRAGFGRFFENIATHLLNGVSGWLFGQAQQAGITPPQDFSVGAIFGFVLQVLGVSVEHVFERLAAKLDPATVRRLRQIYRTASGVWRFLTVLIDQGPAALWAEIQGQLSNLWDTVVQGVVTWVTEAIVNRAMRWLLALLDVTGIMPVINAMVAVYNAIESVMQYLREMLEIVSRVLDGVLDIAQGAIDTAAGFLVDALSRAMPVAIGFLANQFGLGRLGERLHELLETVRAVVDRAIDWLLDRAIAGGRALLDMARSGAAAVRDTVGAVVQWWRRRFGFTTESGEEHALYLDGEGEEGDLMVASTPQRFTNFLAALPDSSGKTTAQTKYRLLQQLRRRARSLGNAPAAGGAAGGSDPLTSTDPQVVSSAIVTLIEEIAVLTRSLMPAGGGASTAPVFAGVTGEGWAQSATISRLNAQRGHWPVRGGEPSVTSARWQRLAQRRSDGNAGDHLYVKGHLLNHNLDGPGNLWENLAPITQEANNRGGASMLHAFETDVKTAVDGGGSVRNFTVTMHYGRGARSAALRGIDSELATATVARRSALRAVREVVDEEQHIPDSIRCRAEILDSRGRRTANRDLTVSNTITTDWRRYTVVP